MGVGGGRNRAAARKRLTMGWSCAAAAGDVLRAWDDACIASTGLQNVYEDGGVRYMVEVSRREHDDGAITGTILRNVPVTADMIARGAKPDSIYYRRCGSFRIDGDGTVRRAPAFLKRAATNKQSTAGRGIGSGGPR